MSKILLILASISQGAVDSKLVNIPNVSSIDANTSHVAKPTLLKESSHSYKLRFSDEFNDDEINQEFWTVENRFVRDRGAIKLYSSDADVEEQDGKLSIYYSRDKEDKKRYYAGRINSKDKYTFTYGFIEARMHIVEPFGHQTAFWLMPQGNGMQTNLNNGAEHDGTAHDGAEVDIVEGNQLSTYSTGIHWDGYGENHQNIGVEIPVTDFFSPEYQVFGFEWSKDSLKWYLNGKLVREEKNLSLIMHVPHFIYFSGSMWGDTSDWPYGGSVLGNKYINQGGVDRAYIDYVRVFQSTE